MHIKGPFRPSVVSDTRQTNGLLKVVVENAECNDGQAADAASSELDDIGNGVHHVSKLLRRQAIDMHYYKSDHNTSSDC